MKLIIDIPELFYNNSKKRVSSGIDLPIDKYVANGTPYTERPQGEWIIVQDKYGESFECPFCSKQVCGTDLNFCVKCGAKMKGDAE